MGGAGTERVGGPSRGCHPSGVAQQIVTVPFSYNCVKPRERHIIDDRRIQYPCQMVSNIGVTLLPVVRGLGRAAPKPHEIIYLVAIISKSTLRQGIKTRIRGFALGLIDLKLQLQLHGTSSGRGNQADATYQVNAGDEAIHESGGGGMQSLAARFMWVGRGPTHPMGRRKRAGRILSRTLTTLCCSPG